jgi:hypothetical protein
MLFQEASLRGKVYVPFLCIRTKMAEVTLCELETVINDDVVFTLFTGALVLGTLKWHVRNLSTPRT